MSVPTILPTVLLESLQTSSSAEQWAHAHEALIGLGAAVINAFGFVALVVNLVFMAFQSRTFRRQTKHLESQTDELIRQGRRAAMTARVSSLRTSMLHLREVEEVFIEHPHLHAYFHSGEETPADQSAKAQVLTVANALADCLEVAILEAEAFARDDIADWRENARVYLGNSPTLRVVVAEHETWWPSVYEELEVLQGTSDPGSA